MDLEVTSLQRTKPGGKFTKANKSKLKKSFDIVKQQQMLKTLYTNNALRNKVAIDWPLSNRSINVPPLTVNFKIISIICRILGCHPQPLWSSEKMPSTAKIAKLYSMLWAIIIMIEVASQIRDLTLCELKTDDDSLCIVRVILTIFTIASHLISVLVSLFRADNFQIAIARIQYFDEATCSENKNYLLSNIVAAGLLILSWCTVLLLAPLHLLFVEPSVTMFILGLWVFSLEIYRFCFVLIAVLQRFERLKTLISSGGIDVGATKGVYYQPLTVQNVLTLHYWLSDAVANFNKYFSIHIVYWLVYTIGNLICSAFTTVFSALRTNLQPAHVANFVYLICNPTLICAVSHFTCKKANELGKLLFGFKAPELETTVSSMEVLEFGFYLYLKPLRITGSEMFTVDLPLLLAVFEASATYMTLIVQNGPEFYDKIAVNRAYWVMNISSKTGN